MYNFSNNWFKSSELNQVIHNYLPINAVNKILEIGSFEGQCTVHIADNYCTHPESIIVSVDPFDLSDTTTHIEILQSKPFYLMYLSHHNHQKLL